MTVLRYSFVLRNPKGIFNTVQNADTHLSMKLIRKCCTEVMYYSAQHPPPEVTLLVRKMVTVSGTNTGLVKKQKVSAPVWEYSTFLPNEKGGPASLFI